MNFSSTQSIREVDVMVIGGGPGGATTATLLADRGWSVALADKDVHPRFHIGESLLPLNLPLLEKLGLRDRMEDFGLRKYAAEFTSVQHGKTVAFEFSKAWDKTLPYSYQVRRADFDDMLIKHAASRGVEVHEGCRIASVDFNAAERVVVRERVKDGPAREWHAKFVVDASGRDTLLSNQFNMKQKNPRHASSALYGHFRNAKRHEGQAEGNISIFWFDHGWFWFIPLADGSTSVGAVCWPYYLRARKVDPTAYFLDTIKTCPPLAARLADAELMGPVTATGNYSYESERTYGDRFILIGDAYSFVDPVFSAGVYLAMSSGFSGAETVDTVLREPARAAAALKKYDYLIRHGLNQFRWFVYRMTSPSLRDMFMSPRNVLGIEASLLSLLAGDVFRNRSIQRRLLVFKAIYYAHNVFNPRRTIAAWKRRRQIIRNAHAADTSTTPALS